MCVCVCVCKFRRRKWQPTPVFLLGESHGQRNLVDYTVHGVAQNQTQLSVHACTYIFTGEQNFRFYTTWIHFATCILGKIKIARFVNLSNSNEVYVLWYGLMSVENLPLTYVSFSLSLFFFLPNSFTQPHMWKSWGNPEGSPSRDTIQHRRQDPVQLSLWLCLGGPRHPDLHRQPRERGLLGLPSPVLQR